jgi:hypothetical protein
VEIVLIVNSPAAPVTGMLPTEAWLECKDF